jgi:hypothetical protein
LLNLAHTVSDLRSELHDPSYRLKVYLAAPYVSGLDANANVQLVLDRYATLNVPELELAGFYWGFNEDGWNVADPVRIHGTAAYLHDRGYELIWIPYFGANFVTWRAYGFDRATIQPNYAFRNVDLTRFAETDDKRRSNGLSGIEVELGPARNNTLPAADPELASARAYFTAVDQYNWSENGFNTYYWVTPVAQYRTAPNRREIYDALYRMISVQPRHSVLARDNRVTVADTFVEKATGYTQVNHGKEPKLNMGTNAYPNALHTYVAFDLANAPAPERLLAAHLRLGLQAFPYGDMINDVDLYLVKDTTWSESTLTGATEPPASQLTPISVHRVASASAYPARYSLDVTSQIASALAAGSSRVSFMLRRTTEDNATAEATFQSRETQGTMPPTLSLLYRPDTDAGAPATDGGSPDAPFPPTDARWDAPSETRDSSAKDDVADAAADRGGQDVSPDESDAPTSPAAELGPDADSSCGCRSSSRGGTDGALVAAALARMLRRRRLRGRNCGVAGSP